MIYYKNQVSEQCMEVLKQGHITGVSQEGPGIDDLVLMAIPMLVETGTAVLYHEGNIVYMLRRKTAWIGQVDIFVGEHGSIMEAVKVGRKAIAWAVENTYYHRLEARSPFPMMKILAKRLGFELEGYRKESFKDNSGAMLDEIEVGLILRRPSWQSPH